MSATCKRRAAADELGVRVYVLTPRMEEADQGEFVRPVSFGPRLTRWHARAVRKVKVWYDRDVYAARVFSDMVHHAVSRLHHEVGLDMFECEESFGWCNFRQPMPAPVVVRVHGPWFVNGPAMGAPRDSMFRRRNRDECRGILAADAITAPSADVLDRTRAFFDIPLQGAAVIPNPIPAVPNRERWQLKGCGPEQILFVGRFDRHKGADVMIDAFAALLRRLPRCHLTIVGPERTVTDDAGRTWSLEEYLNHRLPTAEARSQVQCLGSLPHGQIAKLRRQAMITVIASRYENFPMAALEGMSMGCPMVVSRVGGLKEMFEHQRNGLQFQPGDADDLATQLQLLIQHPALAQRLGRQAAEDCAQRYEPDTVARLTLDIYRSLIAQQKAAPRPAPVMEAAR